MTDRLTPLLAVRPWLLADGATGSNLFERGLLSGDAQELWNSDHPDRVADLQRAFVDAGADRAGRVVLVGGSMGPTGEILEPLGPLSLDAARDAFAEQALARGGADLLWIETMSSIEETEAAVAGARETGLPVIATLSFDTNGRTMMGITPSELAALHRKHHLAACGSNCGIPQFIDGEIRFNGTPELMAQYACLSLDAGARIIGCCGTTPGHLRIMRQALESHVRGPKPDLATIESKLGAISAGATAQLRGEMSGEAGAAAGANTRRTTGRRGTRVENT